MVSRKALSLFFKQRCVLVNDVLIGFFKISRGCFLVCVSPDQPCQLLYVGRVIVCPPANLLCQICRNVLAGHGKTVANVIHPIGSPDFRQINHIAEFVKREALPFKKFVHQVLFAAKQAIGHRLLQLPYRTQAFLENLGILEFGNLLKFIDANDEAASFFLCNLFRQLQNLVDVVVLGIHFKRYREIGHWICADRHFRANA